MRPGEAPPPEYYADLLLHVLTWVATRHRRLLRPADEAWAGRVKRLDADARRLYVRLLQRSRPLIRQDRIAYREVSDRPAALERLARCGLVALDPWAQSATLLGLATVDELRAWWPDHGTRGLKRAELVAAIARAWTSAEIAARLVRSIGWCQPLGRLHLQRFLLAYFGRERGDFGEFIAADLGIVRFERYPVTGHRLADVQDADAYLEFGRLRRQAGELAPDSHPELVDRLDAIPPGWARSEASRARLRSLRGIIGRWQERRGDVHTALTTYGAAQSPPALERAARVLRAHGRCLEASAVASCLATDDRSDGVRETARRWLGYGTCLRGDDDETLWLAGDGPEATRCVEQAALAAYRARGLVGAHCESDLIATLFGLLFWDIVFAPLPGAFSHPYQAAPADLYSPEFFARRRDAIAARLAAIRGGHAEAILAAWWYARHGVRNDLVSWRLPWSLVIGVVRRLPSVALAELLERVARNPVRARRGWPDLVLLSGAGCRFVEVKGPGDSLRPEQRVRLGWLQSLGQRAGIAWVRWL